MDIRPYDPADCHELIDLFYHTVHTVNAKDYTSRQLDAWAGQKIDPEAWNRSLAQHYTLVAVEDGVIVGFGDMDDTGYLDRLYVHRDHQRQGIASALCDRLEAYAGGRIVTHASLTAKAFFVRRGYTVVREQQVRRQGVLLTNFVMQKNSA